MWIIIITSTITVFNIALIIFAYKKHKNNKQ